MNKAVIPHPQTSPSHILIVEDEPDIQVMLRDLITRLGHKVTIVDDGDPALEVLINSIRPSQPDIDVVLLDIGLPRVNGLQVLEQMRSHPVMDLRYVRIVVLTAFLEQEKKIEALNLGADDYLTKPFEPEELIARVNTQLRSIAFEKEKERQKQQMGRLNQVGQEMARSEDPRAVIKMTAFQAQRLLDCEVVALFFPRRSMERIVCHTVSGTDIKAEEFPLIPQKQGIIGQTAEQPTVFRLNGQQIAEHPHFHPATDTPPGMALESILSVPVISRGQTWAVLCAFNKKGGYFLDFDLDLIASLSTFLGAFIDNNSLVSNLRKRQREILDSRNSLQAIIDGILQPIYTIDDEYHLILLNQRKAADLEANETTVFTGQKCYHAFFKRATPCEHCHVHQTLKDQSAQFWVHQEVPDDSILPNQWDIHTYPLSVSSAHKKARAVIVWQDRTEEKRLERSLLQAGKLAAIGQLAAGVAHEINNPLTAINANAEMLGLFIPKDDENYESVDLIRKAGERATKIVQSLLNFSRENTYTFEPLSVNKLIEQSMELSLYQLRSAGIDVHSHLSDNLPDIMASPEHLKSVWINMLVNARDAMADAGTETPTIEIISREIFTAGHSQIEVLFKDNGPGIEKNKLNHIFEPFFTTKAPGKGTGLGLAMCHRIIEEHNGLIEVISEPGHGATFLVRLPAVSTHSSIQPIDEEGDEL